MERDNLIEFIKESNKIEGIFVIRGVEIEAYEKLLKLSSISVKALEDFVSVVQPGARLRDELGMDVFVGMYTPPLGGPYIREQLEQILSELNFSSSTFSNYKFHHTYECLHPFTDGNGRSGRALWLWARQGVAPLGFLHQWYYDSLRCGGVQSDILEYTEG